MESNKIRTRDGITFATRNTVRKLGVIFDREKSTFILKTMQDCFLLSDQ